MNCPVLNESSYDALFDNQYNASKIVCDGSMDKAAKEVRSDVGADITVSVDGTWHRRGHSSHNGVVTAISADTGKCLDAEVLSNYCKQCQSHENLDKNSEEYIAFQRAHSDECRLNHEGTANSMESAGAVAIFSRSVNKHNIRYTGYLGDGDSSSFGTVCENKPYGDCEIQKYECIGHVRKRVGSRLRKLKKDYKGKKLSDGKVISGAGRLTDTMIDKLQNYFGIALRQNTSSVVDMQQNLMASLYHVSSSDGNPCHYMCPQGADSWCKWQENPLTYKHGKGLPQCIVELIEPIYDELTSPELLQKCLHGRTQNANEALNQLIWDRCVKTKWAGRRIVEDATFKAISHFNDGSKSLLKILEQLGVSPGHFSEKLSKCSDRDRIRDATRKSAEKQKLRRKVLRAKKKGFNERLAENEGVTYEKGSF